MINVHVSVGFIDIEMKTTSVGCSPTARNENDDLVALTGVCRDLLDQLGPAH